MNMGMHGTDINLFGMDIGGIESSAAKTIAGMKIKTLRMKIKTRMINLLIRILKVIKNGKR